MKLFLVAVVVPGGADRHGFFIGPEILSCGEEHVDEVVQAGELPRQEDLVDALMVVGSSNLSFTNVRLIRDSTLISRISQACEILVFEPRGHRCPVVPTTMSIDEAPLGHGMHRCAYRVTGAASRACR